MFQCLKLVPIFCKEFKSFSDSDSRDSEPSDDLLTLYDYKLEQLREMTQRIYNADNINCLSVKLSNAQRAPLLVSMYKSIFALT